MTAAPLPPDEDRRLDELVAFGVLDTPPEQAYDDLTLLAAEIADCPIAAVSLIDADRQWFKSRVGTEATEAPRALSFCAHAILAPDEVLVVSDAAADPRFADNPLVQAGPAFRFYAGAPLVTPTGRAVGTLCVIDEVPRELTEKQLTALRALSRQVAAQLELRLRLSELEEHARQQARQEEQLKEYQRRLEDSLATISEQSITDPLTGLRNRRALETRLSEELARFHRYDVPLSLALIDVDHFKPYNDEHGHLAGDEVLRRVADALARSCRDTDIVARYGGEEFVVVFANTPAEGAVVLAERIRAAVAAIALPTGTVTISAGVAEAYDGTLGPSDLLSSADEAMYAAKALGRDRVVTAVPPTEVERAATAGSRR